MTTFLIIYLIGCLLSFLRIYASLRELNESYRMDFELGDVVCIALITFLSWFGFLTGIYFYFTENEKRFF